MAYHLEPHKPIAGEIKRVLKEEAMRTAEQLRSAKNPGGEKAIHEARKGVKKIRAALRLVQAELGSVYREENVRFRDIGRTLSELRDAGAMVETFDGLRKLYKSEVDRQAWDSLRRILEKRKQETERSLNAEQLFQDYPHQLEAVAEEVDNWPLDGNGFSVLAPGLKKAFRRGREAMQEAQRNPTPENFHEWRKRVKDHWYHVRLLHNIWSDMMESYGDVLKDIQTWLGDDHNLTVLEGLITDANGQAGGGKNMKDLLVVMARHQARLREQATIAGIRVYREKPKRLVQAMTFLWKAPVETAERLEEL
ncbi:MAG TPA: CHAD domain-containing protein [Bryobacteraceae bacterium]|nr:CHAD domain-containing protein [Bryobacteraceae bacterium]